MPKVFITKEAHNLIRSMAENPFKEDGVELPNGEVVVSLSDETLERLGKFSFPNETISDAIIRLIVTRGGKQ